jgi:glycerophosphoryl diester phosphodiesterase
MEIIAHRGASGHAPENTLVAFLLAWQQGADGIELDVHLSHNQRVMVHHDRDTRRTTGREWLIAATHSSVLRELDGGMWRGAQFAGESMRFLEEVLAIVPPDKTVLVEIKCGHEIVPALQAALGHVDSGLRLSLISMELDTLAACQEALPQFPRHWVIRYREDVHPWDPGVLIRCAQSHGFAGLDLNYRGITADLAAAIRGADLKLYAWTVNDPDEARRLRDLGVDGLITDYPDEIRQALS